MAPPAPGVDSLTTGAIAPNPKRSAQPALPALPAALEQEDRRRALGALEIALDPQGNGAAVRWDNPESKAHGLVTPVGYAYPEQDRICRKFVARFETGAGAETDHGAACRDKNAEWSLAEIRKED
jgi:surface antigen